MGLNLNNGGGEYKHHIRYMASTSSWSKSNVGEQKGQTPFTFSAMIFDLENIKTGWCVIAEGEAPQWVMDDSLTQMAPKPSDGKDWKRGFKVDVFSKTLFESEPVREFGTSGTGAVKAIEALYEQFEKERGGNAGKVPVVEYKGSVPTKIGKGNTTIPTLVITKWVDRPDELKNTSSLQPAAAPQNSVSEF